MCTGNSISLIHKNISVRLQNDINVKQKQRIKRIIIMIIIIITSTPMSEKEVYCAFDLCFVHMGPFNFVSDHKSFS